MPVAKPPQPDLGSLHPKEGDRNRHPASTIPAAPLHHSPPLQIPDFKHEPEAPPVVQASELPAPIVEPPKPSTSGTIHLGRTDITDVPDGDSIFIDNEGLLHTRE